MRMVPRPDMHTAAALLFMQVSRYRRDRLSAMSAVPDGQPETTVTLKLSVVVLIWMHETISDNISKNKQDGCICIHPVFVYSPAFCTSSFNVKRRNSFADQIVILADTPQAALVLGKFFCQRHVLTLFDCVFLCGIRTGKLHSTAGSFGEYLFLRKSLSGKGKTPESRSGRFLYKFPWMELEDFCF